MTGFPVFCESKLRFAYARPLARRPSFWRPDGSARSYRADSDLRESREIEKNIQTYVIHLFYVLGALIFVARYPSWSKKALSNQTSTRAFPVSNPWEFMAVYVLYSEFLNFFVWLCVEIKILRRVRAES